MLQKSTIISQSNLTETEDSGLSKTKTFTYYPNKGWVGRWVDWWGGGLVGLWMV